MTIEEAVEKGIIEKAGTVCPYCMDRVSEAWSACCGEAGHGEQAYEVANLDYLVLEHELQQALKDRAKFLAKLETLKLYRPG